MRPVGHEDRLSLVEHLDELRSRLIVSLLVFFAAFAICYWQNDWLLHAINQPLEQAQHLNQDGTTTNKGGPLQEQATYARRVGDAARLTAPVLQGQRDINRVLSRERKLTAAEQALLAPPGPAAAPRPSRPSRPWPRAVPRNQERQPVTLGVTEPFVTTFTVAGYAALLLSLPFLLYQAYAFVLPAFSPAERKVALPVMAMVPVLFIAGVRLRLLRRPAAGRRLPAELQRRLVRHPHPGLGLLQVLGRPDRADRAAVPDPGRRAGASRAWASSAAASCAKNRGYVILGLAIVAAVATPTPDPVTMLIAMAPLVVLFELSVLLARIFERRADRARRGSDADDDDDDDDDDVDLEPWASEDPDGDRSLS